MNKNKYTGLLISILLILCLSSEAQTWPKIYGEPNRDDFSYAVVENYDKGYFILGGYESTSGVPKYTWLIKTDINGNVLWDKILKCNGFVKSFACEPTQDGGLLISGLIILNSMGLSSHPLVVKLNSCGEKEWCKVFTGSPNDYPGAIDVKETDSNDIVLLVDMFGDNPEETMHLFKLNIFGDVIWEKPFSSGYLYPESAQPLGSKLYITSNEKYLIIGTVYWANPWNPGGPKAIRPLVVLADSTGNEEWVLPFGLNDTIIGTADDVVDIGNGTYIGVGSRWYSQDLLDPLFMEFNNDGDEINHIVVSSQLIDSTVIKGSFEEAEIIDSMLISEGLFGFSDYPTLYDVLSNKNIFPSNFNIIDTNKYEVLNYPYSLNKTLSDKILSNSTLQESDNWDIALSKLNLNLEYDTLDPGNYTYDSLCTTPGLPQSGFIFLDDCDIITGVDIPSPEEYYASLKVIPITAFPNPVKDKVTFGLENTEHHKNITLKCFNLLGKRVFETTVITSQKETATDVSRWPQGMYVAVVYSEGLPVGECKFVVE